MIHVGQCQAIHPALRGIMRQLGVVLETNGSHAQVRLSASEECSGCGACSAAEGLIKAPEISVDNSIQAAPGQPVLIEFDPAQTLKSGALVFIVPIVGLLLGAIAGASLGGSETAAVLGALGALGASVGGLALYDRWPGRRVSPSPRIIEVLSADQLREYCESGVVH